MNRAASFLALLLTAPLLLVSEAAAVSSATTLWLDDENTYLCDDPFLEQGFSVRLTSTTAEDCDGGGQCGWGWSEGVIYMHPVRLEVDLTPAAVVDSATVYFWDIPQGDMRVFLYDAQGGVIDQATGEWYGEALTVRGGAEDAAVLAVSACEGELYEIELWLSETSGAPTSVRRILELGRAWPNPFNPICNVEYVLESPDDVSLDIFDPSGARVRSLLSAAPRGAGRHSERWDGRDDRGRDLPAGTYLGRVRASGEARTVRLTLVR